MTPIAIGSENEVPIACSLQAEALRDRVADWRALLEHVLSRTTIERGMRLELSPETPLEALTRLVVDEQRCCPFLQFAITVDGRGVGLEVGAPDEARSIVEALFGAGPAAT